MKFRAAFLWLNTLEGCRGPNTGDHWCGLSVCSQVWFWPIVAGLSQERCRNCWCMEWARACCSVVRLCCTPVSESLAFGWEECSASHPWDKRTYLFTVFYLLVKPGMQVSVDEMKGTEMKKNSWLDRLGRRPLSWERRASILDPTPTASNVFLSNRIV